MWNMRIAHPRADLLQHTDDIDSAFRRMLYHPDLAVVFAYVFQELLLVPVGNIFGSRNAPAWFTTPAEIRAHMANRLQYEEDRYELARSLRLPDEPDEATVASFVQAAADEKNPGRVSTRENPGHHVMFVDDNICVAIREFTPRAVAGAVGSAYDCFGDLSENARRGSVLSDKKFDPTASHRVVFVGCIVDTRKMRVSWPEEKRARALAMIDDWLGKRTSCSPAEVSQLLGLLRHGIAISPAGNFLSIRLQLLISSLMTATPAKKLGSKGWWHKNRVHITDEVFRDLRLLRSTLAGERGETLWSRPIGLLVPRVATATFLSNASYGGLGGWSPTYGLLWRLTRQDLMAHGFNMREIDSSGEARRTAMHNDEHKDTLHINLMKNIRYIHTCILCDTSLSIRI